MSAIPAPVRALVLERDGGCLRCGHTVEGRPYSLHHRRGRRPLPGMPDPHVPENLVTLCGHGSGPGCPWWVHQHPAESYADGWMVYRSGCEDPAVVPVLDLMGHAWLVGTGLIPASDSEGQPCGPTPLLNSHTLVEEVASMSRPQTQRWSRDRQVAHVEPSARALGALMWIAVLVTVAALVGCGWGWLTSGGLLRVAAEIGAWQ